MDTIVFGDIVATIVTHLDTLLSVPVNNRVPNPRPAAFVLVSRVGGTRETMVSDAPMLTVEAWAQTPEAAHDLIQAARAHIYAMTYGQFAGVQIYRVTEAGGPAALPDPLSDQPRYSMTVQVSYRGQVI